MCAAFPAHRWADPPAASGTDGREWPRWAITELAEESLETVGIDLAVRPARTGVCLATWSGSSVSVRFPKATDDSGLLALLGGTCERVAIDVPLGWPVDFVESVNHYMSGTDAGWPADPWSAERDWTSSYFRLRETDQHVALVGQLRPLSVSADKLGATAMKAAWLLSAARAQGVRVDRSGVSGRILEAYPAAAAYAWGLSIGGYKNKTATKIKEIMPGIRQNLTAVAGGLQVSGLEDMTNEHHVDALLCAFVARAAALGQTAGPPAEHIERAQLEGWIHVPTGSLEGLAAEPER